MNTPGENIVECIINNTTCYKLTFNNPLSVERQISGYAFNDSLHHIQPIEWILVNLPQFIFKEYGGLTSFAD